MKSSDGRIAESAVNKIILIKGSRDYLNSIESEKINYYSFLVAKALILLGDKNGIIKMMVMCKDRSDLGLWAKVEIEQYVVLQNTNSNIEICEIDIDKLSWNKTKSKFVFVE